MKQDGDSESPAGSPDQAPPADLARRVGGTVGEKFIAQGADLKRCLLQSLPPDFVLEGKRILDFGCGSGRVLRHFREEARNCEFFGCDIDAPSIEYLKENFPRYNVFCNGESPPLPVDDGFFDLIYCVSVFTHLPHTWNEWLHELHRLLKPGGVLLATFLSKAAYENTLKKPFDRQASGFIPEFLDRPWNRGGPNVYTSNDWIADNWGRVFSIEALFDEGMMNWQSIALMRKIEGYNADNAPPPRVVRPFVYQDYCGKDILGNIEFDKFPSSSWHAECGIQARGNECLVRGWFVSRDSGIDCISFFLNGNRVEASWEAVRRDDVHRKHPDYTNSTLGGFLARLNVSNIMPGAHDLKVIARDGSGKTKEISVTLHRV